MFHSNIISNILGKFLTYNPITSDGDHAFMYKYIVFTLGFCFDGFVDLVVGVDNSASHE